MEGVGVGIGVLNCVGGSILSGDGATERMGCLGQTESTDIYMIYQSYLLILQPYLALEKQRGC
jgi:hypothetical protein